MKTESLISLETARAHLRVGDDRSMDELIQTYLDAAVGVADDVTNRNLKEEFTAETLPPAIKAAILLIVGTLFDNESDVQVGRTVSALPMSAERLLLPWRVHPYSMTEAQPQPQPQPEPEPEVELFVRTINPPEDDVRP